MAACDLSRNLGGRWKGLTVTPGIQAGSGGSCPESPCRWCPALCKCACGEEGYGLSSAPLVYHPNNGDWAPWWLRLLQQSHLWLHWIPASTHPNHRLCSHSQPQSSPWVESLKPKFQHPAHPSGCMPQAEDSRVVALTTGGVLPLLWLLPTSCCALLWGSEAPVLSQPTSLPVRRLPGVQESFLFHSPLPRVQDPSWFLSAFVVLFLISRTQLHGDFLALSVVWSFLPALSRYSVRIIPCVDVFLMYLWKKLDFISYYSAILGALQMCLTLKSIDWKM